MLLVDRLQLHADRDLWRQLVQLGVRALAHIDDVLGPDAGHTHREGLDPVVPDQHVGRFLTRPPYLGKVEQVQKLAADPHREAGNLLYRVIPVRALYEGSAILVLNRSTIDHGIGCRQRALNGRWRHIQIGGQGQVRLDIDDLVRHAGQAYIGDAIDSQQFTPQKGGKVVDLGIGKPGGRDGIINAVDIPEPFIHERRPDPGRQAYRTDPVAQLGPDLGQFLAVVLILHVHGDP